MERRRRRGAVDGRRRRGGDARLAGDVAAGLALRGRAGRAARRAGAVRARGDARVGARAGDRCRTRPSAPRRRSWPSCAAGSADDAGRARDARGRRRHASDRALGGHRGLAGRALPVRARVDARAGAARADVRAARPRRRAGARGGVAGAERAAAAHAGAARAVGQLAVLAGPRQRPRVRAHAGVPGVPAHRHRRAGSRDYADYVEAIDVLVRCDAIPEPTFLWWDARLQPALRHASRCG